MFYIGLIELVKIIKYLRCQSLGQCMTDTPVVATHILDNPDAIFISYWWLSCDVLA